MLGSDAKNPQMTRGFISVCGRWMLGSEVKNPQMTRGFISVCGRWMLLCKEPDLAEDGPCITMQRIISAFECSLGVPAGFRVL